MQHPLTGIAPPLMERAVADLCLTLTEDDAERVERLLAYIRQQAPMLREIRDAVSEFYAVDAVELVEPSRCAETAFARHVFCYFAYRYTRYSYAQIGKFVGLTNHTSVWHAVRRIEKWSISRPLVHDDLDLIRMRIAEKMLLRTKGSA